MLWHMSSCLALCKSSAHLSDMKRLPHCPCCSIYHDMTSEGNTAVSCSCCTLCAAPGRTVCAAGHIPQGPVCSATLMALAKRPGRHKGVGALGKTAASGNEHRNVNTGTLWGKRGLCSGSIDSALPSKPEIAKDTDVIWDWSLRGD